MLLHMPRCKQAVQAACPLLQGHEGPCVAMREAYDENLVILPLMPLTLASEVEGEICLLSQYVVKPRRLIFNEGAEFFSILDIKVGKNSQLHGAGEVPATVFNESTLYVDTLQISMGFYIRVKNTSGCRETLRGTLFAMEM